MISALLAHSLIRIALQLQATILNIVGGAPPPPSPVHNYCFSNPDEFGIDSGTQRKDFEIFGGRTAQGLTTCDGSIAAYTPVGPQSFHVRRPMDRPSRCLALISLWNSYAY